VFSVTWSAQAPHDLTSPHSDHLTRLALTISCDLVGATRGSVLCPPRHPNLALTIPCDLAGATRGSVVCPPCHPDLASTISCGTPDRCYKRQCVVSPSPSRSSCRFPERHAWGIRAGGGAEGGCVGWEQTLDIQSYQRSWSGQWC